MNALFIPVHSLKLNWLCMFLQSIPLTELPDADFDLVLLVSNEKEKIQIYRAIQSLLPVYLPHVKFFDVYLYIKIYMNDDILLDRYINNSDRCIVNLKKFISLYWGRENYDYIAVIDCDTVVNKSIKNIFKDLVGNYHSKLIFSGGERLSDSIISIQKDCSSFFDSDDYEMIKSSTDNFNLYTWFFDVPFYSKEHLIDFFDYFLVNKSDFFNFWHKIKWESFEHIIYVYYLLLFKGYAFINYSTIIKPVIPENLSLSDLNAIYLKYNYYPTWVRFRNILNNPENMLMKEPHFYYHMDRS